MNAEPYSPFEWYKRAKTQDVAREHGQHWSKVTHIALMAEAGRSKPQASSIRGQVLAHLRATYEVGHSVSIARLETELEPILRGGKTTLRQMLAKLRQTDHIAFTRRQ